MYKCAIGQDSHRFETEKTGKALVLGGVTIPGAVALEGNSDADVILHALTNAVSGISGVVILGPVSDRLCLEQGITDSSVYLQEALKTLGDYRITHVSISLEAAVPKITPHIPALRQSIAGLMGIAMEDVGITATTGEGLTDFGRGEGIQALVVVTAMKKQALVD
jgi:2-C-methyl-D-erythritol 2,4-cyclodiphosphate synthase